MMKKLLLALAFAAVLTGCHKTPVKEDIDISGCWELTTVATKATVGGTTVNVYISFDAAGSFSLYQSLGSDRYTLFSGKWTLDQDTSSLSGTYSGGAAWGPYTVALSGETLSLTSSGEKEVDTYKKISSIPESVLSKTY